MKYICVYTDLANQGLTYKAEIECDHIEVMDTAEFSGEQILIAFVKNEKAVFLIHEYRMIEAYAADSVIVSAIDKKQLNAKKARDNNLVLTSIDK